MSGRHQPSGNTPTAGLASTVAVGQGVFYLLMGLWPLLSIGSFQAVTGPKRDLWLVKTVGVLVSVIGAVLILAGRRRRPAPEMALLAAGSAAGLTGIDVAYAARGTISKIYLLDALVETGLVAAWALAWCPGRDEPRCLTHTGHACR